MNTYDPNYKQLTNYFAIGQKVVVVNTENKILFLKRSDKCTRAGGWDFPGGGLEKEQPIEGIKRETKEETNLTITRVEPVALITNIKKDTLTIGYLAHYHKGNIKLSWEHDKFEWLTIPESLKVNLPQIHQEILRKAIKRLNHSTSE